MFVFMAVRDYFRALHYAFFRPWGAEKDSHLHSHAIASIVGILCGGLGAIRVVVDDDRFENLLFGSLFLALGLAEGALIVHRYRRRDEPEPDHIEQINSFIDKIVDARKRRKARQKSS